MGNVVEPKSLKPNGQTRAYHLNICGKVKVHALMTMLWPWLGLAKKQQALRKFKELTNG
jgi:hypothetical protein